MVQCHYCARSGLDNKLEYIPHKKEYYCKRCEYHFSENTISDMLPKTEVKAEAGGFQLTVIKEDVAKEVKETKKEDYSITPKQVKGIYKTSIKKK